MFYFTGLPHVPSLDSNRFLPGAIADHLTSAGGELFGGSQMSSLAWLEAGATGSYGAVVEPCNFPAKFPAPGIVMAHYLQDETLIEAYWKSVQMPGQGLFIGEPLARPFAGIIHRAREGGVALEASLLAPGLYDVQAAPSMMGPTAASAACRSAGARARSGSITFRRRITASSAAASPRRRASKTTSRHPGERRGPDA